jgi:hypothetical protein
MFLFSCVRAVVVEAVAGKTRAASARIVISFFKVLPFSQATCGGTRSLSQ